MHRNTVLTAVLAAGLLVAAGAVGALAFGSSPAAATGPADTGQSITVSADGEIEAQPDQAVVQVAITATGNDSTAVRETLAADTETLRDALTEYGVPADEIRTAYYDIRQERERTRNGVERGPYRGAHAFEITIDDTDAAGEVIDVAVENGADTVNGVSFTLSDEKREELYNDALEEAMANAETRADTLASAGDLTVTGVHSILSADTDYRAYRTETAYVAGDSASASTSVQSGPVTVTADVRVTYNATE
jgi:uncharacterized protein YggE